MSSEKQNGIVNRGPIANTTTQSPRWAGIDNGTTRIAASLASNGSSTRRREARMDELGVENGHSPEDVATPVKAFLSSNITPRSGSRKARVESASSTPNRTSSGTPSTTRPVSSIERREKTPEGSRATSGLGLRISTSGRRSRASSVISDGLGSSISPRPPLLERKGSATRTTSPESSPMFVYANDVKASMPSKPTAGRSLSKGPLPGYGQSKDGNISNGRDSSMSNSPTLDEQKPKFFYANDPSNDSKPPPRLSNGVSSHRPPLQTIYSAHTASSPPRAASPLKEEFLPRKSSVNKPSPRRHTRLVSNGGTEIKPSETTSGITNIARRASTNSPRQSPREARVSSHSRSSSAQSAGPSPRRRSSVVLSNMSPVAAERTRTTSIVGSNGALPHSVNPPAAVQELPSTQLPAQPQSPTRPSAVGQSKIDQMNELAAKARRERKVLDLEISNSSLLAINRALEREMRKQNAELRRYRRLSRSGRLSVAPASKSASGKMSFLSESADDSAGETSPLDSDNGENDHEDTLSDISPPSGASSRPSSPTSRAGRTRFQDPKRPELDLAAQRALLLDGQILNQSIKRCLAQTESLIASGKTALEYQARAPTPENLGARVLTPDDTEEAMFGQGQGLLSPSSWTGGNPFERSLGSLDGGLETPDYSKWGPSTDVQTPFAEIGDLMASDELDGATAMDILDVSEKTEDYGIDAAATDLLDGEGNLDGKPNLNERRSDGEISLDGIDDSLDSSSPDDEPYQHDSPSREGPPLQPPSEEEDFSRPSSPSRILNAMRPPDTKSDIPGNVPGNRGSMQNLGHYLQAFSIFGAGQSQA
ncbi:hypothetical protein HO173_007011 [Letharia columbiana]|uniref:Uncharacterized protein n=1 Tax=Letharia columbiana TaxID=112416 RepID=A0A8H6L451_9LECA|nr:uncharacterized protein HO173_007011 [Letharia columbiana]KAF6234791.1 hypothetical protein HO173_007011 [Letharia columbiana]